MSKVSIPAGVPIESAFTGRVINGYTVLTASDLETAQRAVSMARVRGTIGGSELVYELAGPEVMIEQRKVEQWAVVERIDAAGVGLGSSRS